MQACKVYHHMFTNKQTFIHTIKFYTYVNYSY
jgi:hypothetical protein